MTESYSPPDVIKKYYQSADKTKDGAHLPFNFEMIRVIKKNSTAVDFVKMVTDWFKVVPEGKVTNWVVS
jgi:alpha-glucosidase